MNHLPGLLLLSHSRAHTYNYLGTVTGAIPLRISGVSKVYSSSALNRASRGLGTDPGRAVTALHAAPVVRGVRSQFPVAVLSV